MTPRKHSPGVYARAVQVVAEKLAAEPNVLRGLLIEPGLRAYHRPM